MKMDRSSVCSRQGSCFYALGKAMVLQQVPRLLPSIKLINSPELFLTTVFSSCWLLPSWTHHALEQRHSVNKWRWPAFLCRLFFNTKNFFSEGQKNLVNSENNENLSINCENKNFNFEVFRLTLAYFWRSFNYILPGLTPVSTMVSIKISRGKFPRPGQGTSALRIMLLRFTAVWPSPAKNVWLVEARPRDIATPKMAAIPPSFVYSSGKKINCGLIWVANAYTDIFRRA